MHMRALVQIGCSDCNDRHLRRSPAAEGKGPKVLVNGGQQRFGTGQPQRHMPDIKVLHVVAGLQILMHQPLPCSSTTADLMQATCWHLLHHAPGPSLQKHQQG